MGLQPRCLSTFVKDFLDRWATQGVFAGFASIPDSKAPSWAELEGQTTQSVAKLVGAKTDETVLMAGLTINLHLLMASFYRPSSSRTKIIMEKEAFPTDLVRKILVSKGVLTKTESSSQYNLNCSGTAWKWQRTSC